MFKGQPKGLFALALANTGERFGYYTMLAIFMLFLQAKFGFTEAVANQIYAIFLAAVYFMPVFGGMLADRIGYGKCVVTGVCIMFAGYVCLAIPTAANTLGMGLMDALLGCNRVFVLDAVLGGGEPGSVYRLTDESLRKSMSFKDSLHQTDLVDTLIYCGLLGNRPEAVVYGMEPGDYQTMELGLTPACGQSLPRLAQALLDELGQLGVAAKLR